MITTIYEHRITFGDCDPAGIVFYPNVFRWMDATFHQILRAYGGHAVVCGKLDALGIGLVDVSTRFMSPMRDGDTLSLRVDVASWSRRALTLAYSGSVAETETFTAHEVRCLFQSTKTGIVAGDVGGLKDMLEGDRA